MTGTIISETWMRTTMAVCRDQDQIKGATIQFRIYQQTADAARKELGTKTAYLSRTGNWTTIKRSTSGAVEQTMLADAAQAGVFLLEVKNEATKVGDLFQTPKLLAHRNIESTVSLAARLRSWVRARWASPPGFH